MTGFSTITVSPMLAAFVTPALFYGGAAVVSAPILIHLLARRRFKRIRWAAMDFLIDAERRNRRRVQMEEWILLALRCLAIALISMMIARPFLNPSGLAAALGGTKQTERVFVLDDSMSMAYQTREESSFDRSKLAVRRLINAIRREAPDDTVTILRMSNLESPVESGTFLDANQAEELLARLEALEPTHQAIEAVPVINGVADYLQRGSAIVSAAVYLISDFQRKDWATAVAAAERKDATGLLEPLVRWAGEDRSLRTYFINVGDPSAVNMAITNLGATGGQIVAGTNGKLQAKLANFSQTAADNVQVDLFVGPVSQEVESIAQLPAAQIVSFDLTANFPQSGQQVVRAELAPDSLAIDNTRYAVADVARSVRVLVVNGEPSPDIMDDEVALLVTALRPEGDVFSGNESIVVDETELETTSLDEFHAVIIANVHRISDPAVEILERYVRGGGGVIFFLGDQVDPDSYNESLYRDGEGMLPAALTEIKRAPDRARLDVVDNLHPAMRGLAREGDPLGISQIPFMSFFGCVPFDLEKDETIGGLGDHSSMAEALGETPQGGVRPARVIAQFNEPEVAPAIVERPFGRGRTILVTTTADKEWNLWADHPTYLPIINELVRHVSKHGSDSGSYSVGSVIEIPIDPASHDSDALVRTPAYPMEQEITIIAAPTADEKGMALKWEQTPTPGVYQFLLRRRDGGEDLRMVAVNTDPLESDLAACNERDIQLAVGDAPYQYIEGIDDLEGKAGEGRTEFWRVMLIAAVIVLMIEQSLAWRWGARR